MVGRLQPLANNLAIVGPDGKPTEYFIRWAQQRQIDIGEAVSEARALEIVQAFIDDYALQAGSGIAITPDGKLTSNPTISAEAQAILNQISSTRGTILFRGATDWQALAPGTPGQFLKTNGAGADPSWAAGGGGSSNMTCLHSSVGVQSNGSTLSSPVVVHQFTLPANTLTKQGDFLDIEYFCDRLAATSGTKAWNYSLDGPTTGGLSQSTGSAAVFWMQFRLVYVSPTETYILDQGRHSTTGTTLDGGPISPYVNSFTNMVSINVDWTIPRTIGPSVQSNVANTVRCFYHKIIAGIL
jgi:hypothetical protein